MPFQRETIVATDVLFSLCGRGGRSVCCSPFNMLVLASLIDHVAISSLD